jgi:hypothetical protein
MELVLVVKELVSEHVRQRADLLHLVEGYVQELARRHAKINVKIYVRMLVRLAVEVVAVDVKELV